MSSLTHHEPHATDREVTRRRVRTALLALAVCVLLGTVSGWAGGEAAASLVRLLIGHSKA